ncbi:MAG: hypothetical protein A2W19_11340 [Spirochaetes bacterium RBG_16_49_21]|nr:MAG: hypothetical protein A2W19_11340 [Spirochaetes bacterium RBG_16_49_21]
MLLLPAVRLPAESADQATLLLTSNLEGRFIPEIEGQETKDPMLLLGQSIIMESRRRNILYFDLGNSFYPGVLSKQNYGAAMMDFFSYFRCRSALISSLDLRIGVSSLEFLQSHSATRLLSANILKENRVLFKPYTVQEIRGRKIAFVGLSSKRILFDIAEQNVYRISVEEESKALKRVIGELKGQGVDRIILLSGLTYRDNLKLLNAFPEIGLVVAGGDQRGALVGGRVVRIETADRRSIITVPPDRGYCLLTLSLDHGIAVSDVQFRKPAHYPVADERYDNFIERITHWKKQFAEEMGAVVTRVKKPVLLDQKRIAYLLQDVEDAELAIVKNDAIEPLLLEKDISLADILAAVNDNFAVYAYRLYGDDLNKLSGLLNAYSVIGYSDNKIQGYPVTPERKYLVVSTQTVFEEIQKALRRKIRYRNTWNTISDIIINDLKYNRAVLNEDFRYLEKRFRYMVNVRLSAFYEASRVIADDTIKIPVGESDQSYNKWGIEARLDLTLSNRYHKLVLTPYIFYSTQNDQLLNNLLSGTLQYNLNLHPIVNPYQKNRIETVVVPIRRAALPIEITTTDELRQYLDYRKLNRPVDIRETVGVSAQSRYITGNIGFGLEKYIHEPVNPAVFGIEALFAFNYQFLNYLTYGLKLDSFLSPIKAGSKNSDNNYFRSLLENSLSIRVMDTLSFSLRHRWYYYQNLYNNKHYSSTQFLTSCDFRMNFYK